jgi:transcriptional regulator GlxA family with amidase domain
MRAIETHRLHGTAKLNDAFKEVFEEHAMTSTHASAQMMREVNARAAFHRLVIELVRGCRPAGVDDALPFGVARSIELMHETPEDPAALGRICQRVGVNPKELNRQFMESLGTTPSQYWLRERIRLARERLLNLDLSVTEIASEFGFSSSQHFATAFRRIIGLTPTEYRGRASRPADPEQKPR